MAPYYVLVLHCLLPSSLLAKNNPSGIAASLVARELKRRKPNLEKSVFKQLFWQVPQTVGCSKGMIEELNALIIK